MASLQSQMLEAQLETNRKLDAILFALTNGTGVGAGSGSGGGAVGAGSQGAGGGAPGPGVGALAQSAAASLGASPGAGVAASLAAGAATGGITAGGAALFEIAKSATGTALNIAADATNPFRTGFQSSLSAVETLAGKLPFGEDIAKIAFNLTGVTTERAAEQRAFSEASSIASGLTRAGVKLSDEDLRGISAAVKPIALEESRTIERLAKQFGDVPGGPIEELIKEIRNLITSFGGRRIQEATALPFTSPPAYGPRSAVGGEGF